MEALISFVRIPSLEGGERGGILKWPVLVCASESHKQELPIVCRERDGIRAAYTTIGLNFSGSLWRLAVRVIVKGHNEAREPDSSAHLLSHQKKMTQRP